MSDEESDQDDEIIEIRRVMKEAKARKKLLFENHRTKWQQTNETKHEYEEILTKFRLETDELKKKMIQLEYDLRESRYETNQWKQKYTQYESEQQHQQIIYQNQIHDLQFKIESILRKDDEKFQIIFLESEKLLKLFDTLTRNYEITQSQTNQHILGKAKIFLQKIKEFSTIANDIGLQDYRHRVAIQTNQQHRRDPTSSSTSSLQLVTVDSTVDSAMLEMCRNLEEENTTLHETVQSLKEQLNEAKRESSAAQLIPHYRLAIVRSRTYASNLLEQIKREQETSKSLREQLDETYQDLKKVVEEKRKLYKKISKTALEDAELADVVGDERLSVPKQKHYHHYHHHRSRSKEGQRPSHTTSIEREESQYQRPSRTSRERDEEVEYQRPSRSSGRYADLDYDDEEYEYSPTITSSRDRKSNRHHHQKHSSEEKLLLARKKKEESLKGEIESLDSTIEKLKEKLGQAALQESQKILNEVLGANLGDV